MVDTADFFRARLDEMIDIKHPLVVLSKRLPWGAIEQALAPNAVNPPWQPPPRPWSWRLPAAGRRKVTLGAVAADWC